MEMLESPGSLADLKGNYKQGLSKILLIRNEKGFTSYSLAVELGNENVFAFI